MDVPRFNMPAMEKRRRQMLSEVLESKVGQEVNLDQLTTQLRQYIPGVRFDTLFESLRYLAGRQLSRRDIYALAIRLSGNLGRLKANKVVLPWTSQPYDEWVPVKVLRMVKTRNSRDKIGYDTTFKSFAGLSAGMRIQTFWMSRVTSVIASQVGFSKPWGKYPFRNSLDLVGLRLLVHIEAERSRDRPVFYEVNCPPPFVKWNRENILKLRVRADGYTCPFNFMHQCHQCAVGYEQCVGATHYRTYTTGDCTVCGASSTLFDPEDPGGSCIACINRIRTQRRTTD